jgi:hypothetical protein
MKKALTLMTRKITMGSMESNRNGTPTSILDSSLFDALIANVKKR